MTHKPIKYTEWLESRREFMARVGWTTAELNDSEFVDEYRSMLVDMKKDCTVRGIAYNLGTTYSTLMKDRQYLGITSLYIGGSQVHPRLFSHNNKMMTCKQIADLHGCCYATAYKRLTEGAWIA